MSPPTLGSDAKNLPRKSALIVEGGAMRGAWAAGVLALLHERGQHQYDLVYAASSGALSAVYFVTGLWQPGLAIWHQQASKAVRKINFLRRKPIIDLAYLVDNVFRRHFPLSIEALQKAPTHLAIVLTDCSNGEPVYFHARDQHVFDALRATSSLPLVTRGFDYVDGHPFADGGLSDPIPIQRALQDGATDITVVLTHQRGFRLKPAPRWLGRLAFPDFPQLARAWTGGQHLIYNASLDLMNQPPAGVRMRIFRPVRPLPVGHFTTAQKRIDAALAAGHDEALEQLAFPTISESTLGPGSGPAQTNPATP
jgi:predicted patatin/cPLA2 family phospholipase